MTRYMVVVERGETSWGAHVPDLPGCVAVGETREEVLRLIREAIELHIDGLRQDGLARANAELRGRIRRSGGRVTSAEAIMGRIEDIEQQVQALSPEELVQFRAWFLEFDWAAWDRQLERDVRAGKLDALADEK